MKKIKKIKLLSLVFCLIILSNNVFSHGKCRTRNKEKCTNYWKYKAYARVTKAGVAWKQATDKDCPPDLGTGNGVAGVYVQNACAKQSAKNVWGAYTFSGGVDCWKRWYARGYTASDLYYDLAENSSINLEEVERSTNLEEVEKSELTTKATRFEKDAVFIDDFNGYLSTNAKDMASSFEVIIWLPSNEMDSTITDDKTCYRGKIELLNGKVNVTGDFPKDSYTLSRSTNGMYKVNISHLNIKASLPAGIDWKEDLIEVVVESDAGIAEENIISQIIDKTNSDNELNFSLFPNPSQGNINVSLNTNSKELFTVKIYDLSGKEIKVLSNNVDFSIQKNQSFDLSSGNLNKGVYFIMLKSDKNTYLKKLILK